MMRSKWRLFVLLAYAVLLVWWSVAIGSLQGGLGELLAQAVLVIIAVSPIAILCVVSRHHDAMGVLALLVAGFGVWAYQEINGDPIGLVIILFYQYCAMGIGMLAIVLGAHFLKAKS